MKKTIFILSIFINLSFSKGEVSKIFAHRESAISSSYTANGDGKRYKWGEGDNIVIDGFEYNGRRYNYVSELPIIKIRRSDNNNSTGEPCGLFAEKVNSSKYILSPTFPEGCDMAKVMGGRVINIGALDLFKNGNDDYDTAKNIERVDFISPNGIIAPSNPSNLINAGHVVTEKSGNNEIKISAILSLDENGDPSSFGPLVTVYDENGDAEANRKVNYGDTYIYLNDGTIIGKKKLGFYRDEKKAPQTGKPIITGNSNEKLDMAFVTLEDLGIDVGQKYYGFSYFPSDVYDNMDLVDYSSFPKNTPMNSLHHTDTADPYGGVASYFNDIEPLGCLQTAWMFQGHTDINALNLINGKMVSVVKGISNNNINGVGFNKKDGYFWGYDNSEQNGTIARIGIDSSGNWVAQYFKIEGLENYASYVGDIDSNGHLYLKYKNSSRRVVVIDLDPNSDNYLKKIRDFYLTSNLNTADWGFNPKDNMLYAVNNGNKNLYRVDPSNGNVTYLGNTGIVHYSFFGASFFDANGFYYVYNNGTGNIFRIDVANSSKAILFTTARKVSLNDGAMCTDVEFKFDFGDLPNNYSTKLEKNGARHYIPIDGNPTIYLGDEVSSEYDGKPSESASLDSFDDGVKLNNKSLQNQTLNVGENYTLKIKTHGEGFLNGWIDWNGDRDFNDEGEQIATNISGSSGEITLKIKAPSNPIDITTYARFRYSYQKDLLPTGSAIDGEVEDYKIDIHDNVKFNIVRTNANIDDKIIYTQIAGRDFNYRILPSTNENNLTIKIKLFDNINNKTLYEAYKYIDREAQIDITDSSDLKLLDVTRDASFKVYLIKDSSGAILHGNYANKNSYNSILNQEEYSEISQEASKSFTIRPAGYIVNIKDINSNNSIIKYRDSKYSGNDSLKLSAGYKYIIEADAIAMDTHQSKTKNYATNDINSTLIFKDKSNCRDKSNISLKGYHFNNSHLIDNISHSNVGKYKIHIEDSSWSSADGINGGCIIGSSAISENGNIKSGCNISSSLLDRDIDLKFYPYRFNITNINLKNRPNNGRDYIYMSDLNKSLNIGVILSADIIAEDMSGKKTTNFTSSCEAFDTDLSLKYHITTDMIDRNSTYSKIYTIKGSEIDFKRAVSYNQEESFNSVENGYLNNKITIPANKFLDINEGNSSIHILLNLTKNLSEPINPVKLEFNSLYINSSNSSKVKGKNRIADGIGDINKSKLFYFATIAPEQENYEDSYEKHSKISISALIFCKKSVSWCSNMIGNNGLNDIKTRYGWYRAYLHNISDGKVNNFITDTPLVTITPSANNLPSFINGKIGNIVVTYHGNTLPFRVKINMDLSSWLKYHRDPLEKGNSSVRISFRDGGNILTGIGKSGYIVETLDTSKNHNISHSHSISNSRKKIDW